jgi:hypothetical protein
MTAPPASDVIWPEKFIQNQRISAAKKTKSDINKDYYMFLLCHSVATACEASIASACVKNVRVLILDSKDEEKDFLSRRLVAVLDATRSDLESFQGNLLSGNWAVSGFAILNDWQRVLEAGDRGQILSMVDQIETSAINVIKEFQLQVVDLLLPLALRFVSHADVTPSRRPCLLDLTESRVNTSDEIEITINDEADQTRDLAIDIDAVSSPDFWVLCGLLASSWNEDEVEIEPLKIQASQICRYLYPPENEAQLNSTKVNG